MTVLLGLCSTAAVLALVGTVAALYGHPWGIALVFTGMAFAFAALVAGVRGRP